MGEFVSKFVGILIEKGKNATNKDALSYYWKISKQAIKIITILECGKFLAKTVILGTYKGLNKIKDYEDRRLLDEHLD